MTQDASIYINGQLSRFKDVWVHLKAQPSTRDTVRLEIPKEFAPQIFDPYETRPQGLSWPDFIMERVKNTGTVLVENYLRKLSIVAGERHQRPSWVLTFVDSVEETEDLIVIIGRVEKFKASN